MRKIITIAALMAAAVTTTTAFASDEAAVTTSSAAAVEIKKGEAILGANGKRIGRVYQLSTNGDPQVIYNTTLITVPASSISRTDGKLVSTLTLKDLSK